MQKVATVTTWTNTKKFDDETEGEKVNEYLSDGYKIVSISFSSAKPEKRRHSQKQNQ